VSPIYVVGAQVACRRCGKPFIVVLKNQRLCHDPCVRRRSGTPDKPYTTSDAGYGSEHQKRRREARKAWRDGDPCARCSQPMLHGTPVDLDHTDDRTGYLGLSHASCNRSRTGHLERAARPAICDHCGLPYTARAPKQRFCSVPCRKAAPPRPAPARKVKPPRPTRACDTCGSAFPVAGRKRYCSQECASIQCRYCDRRIQRNGTVRPQGEAICHPCRSDHPQRWRRSENKITTAPDPRPELPLESWRVGYAASGRTVALVS
jgi:hypothetical protein